MMQSFFFVFAILAACASIGSTLQCYECEPVNPRDLSSKSLCDDPFKGNNVEIRTCNTDEICLKQILPKISIGNQEIPSMTIRRCAPESICRSEQTQLQEMCHICSEDRCNSADKVISSLSTFIVLYIIKLFSL